MFQGNPFESEMWIKERTGEVQREVQGIHPFWKVRIPEEAWQQGSYVIKAARHRVRALWLPAAFALGAAFGFFVGA
jgi:hypothetical protein